MKKVFALLLVLLVLAIPVSAENYHIHDDSELLKSHDVVKLEQVYSDAAAQYGFTPAIATVNNFGGLSAESFANELYDALGFPEDGILWLVSLQEEQWYILTSGSCHERISDGEAAALGEALVPLIRDGQYYAAFLAFPERVGEIYEANAPVEETVPEVVPAIPKKTFGKTFISCMSVGLVIGGIAVAVMAWQMKSVRSKVSASDYIVPGSAHLTSSRDIYLYSRTTRSPKPKSGHSGGRGGGGSRGGAGGRI